jgi:hypothetical protein
MHETPIRVARSEMKGMIISEVSFILVEESGGFDLKKIERQVWGICHYEAASFAERLPIFIYRYFDTSDQERYDRW